MLCSSYGSSGIAGSCIGKILAVLRASFLLNELANPVPPRIRHLLTLIYALRIVSMTFGC